MQSLIASANNHSTRGAQYGAAMPKGHKSIDTETRERIRAWTIHLMRERHMTRPKDFALFLGFKQSSPVTAIINRTRSAGLDYVLRLHRVFKIQTDVLLDHYPPDYKTTEDYKLS